jgi:Yip1 domain
MNYFQLYLAGVFHPARAFDDIRTRPAPLWAFKVVLFFNLLISATSTLARYLLGQNMLMPSALTFLPDEHYLLAQIFFLPVVRMAAWLLNAAIIHLGIRLAGKPSDMDLILNMAGVGYLVIMPYTFLVDWTTIALNAFNSNIIVGLHGVVDLMWSLALSVIGLRQLLGIETKLALTVSLISSAVGIPLLALFAR